MYTEFYQLSADPFRLMPDHRFVLHHKNFRGAYATMRHMLDQGEGVLVLTGRPGTGKTTLVQHFLAELKSPDLVAATLVSTHLQEYDILRMVSYSFGLESRKEDKATLLRELELFLKRQERALLVIDEAQNLSESALEEVRMLTNIHDHGRQLLQVFLVGQESLHERIHSRAMEQLHQRLMAVCQLYPLNLQETCHFILHRLGCVNWRGIPEIPPESFIVIHRFSQGLPRYISKLCSRFFLQGAVEQRDRLSVDDIAHEIQKLQGEMLLPLHSGQNLGEVNPVADLQNLMEFAGRPIAERLLLTSEESEFLADNPDPFKGPPASGFPISTAHASGERPAERPLLRLPMHAVCLKNLQAHSGQMMRLGYAVLALLVFMGAYQLGALHNSRLTVEQQEGRGSTAPQHEVLALPSASETYWTTAASEYSHAGVRHPFPLVLRSIRTDTETMAAGSELPQTRRSELPRTLPEEQRIEASAIRSNLAQDVDAGAEAEGEVETGLAAEVEAGVATEAEPGPEKELDVLASASPEPAPQVDEPGKEEKISELLQLAEMAIAKDQLMTPEHDSAWRYFQQVLESDPGNKRAEQGVRRVAERYGQLALLMLERDRYDRAELYIRRGLMVAAGDSELLALRRQLEAGREAQGGPEIASASEPESEADGFLHAVKRFFAGSN